MSAHVMRAGMLAAMAAASACSGQDVARQGVVIVNAREAPAAPSFAAPAVTQQTSPHFPSAVQEPLAPAEALEAADPLPAEFASLAIDQNVGVLTTARKAHDPFHAADVDLSDTPEPG